MTPVPSIAVIILNYNSADYSFRCVDSIRQHTTLTGNVSVIVVDNDSAPTDKRKLTRLLSDNVALIYSDKNRGFSGGMMLGAQSIEADYYFFLNNDCELRNNALSVLCNFMEANSQVGLCGASMFDIMGNNRSSFNYFPSLAVAIVGSGLLRLIHPHRYPDRHRKHASPTQVDVVSGAAMFIRGTTLKSLNGLDTGYFLYCEEEDFALRLHKAGWKTYFVPEAEITHIGGASSSEASLRPALQREYYISFFRYLRIHHSLPYATLFRMAVLLKVLRRAVAGKLPFGLAWFVLRGAPEKYSIRYG